VAIINKFELKNVIDTVLLQTIQEKIAQITGLAFVTVDFQGNPITAETNFSEFCAKRRENSEHKKACYFSDAHSGLEAARRNKPYIFRCPAGLVDFAVPIMVRGQYLGAVLSGQVRCPQGNEFIEETEYYKCDPVWKLEGSWKEKYQKTHEMEYSQLIAAAQLVHLVVNQLVEKEVVNIVQEELNRQSVHLVEEKKVRAELEKELKIAELKSLKAQMNPQFLASALNSISCCALIEGAERTQEMTYLYSQLLRYNLENTDFPVSLKNDLKNIERYLKIQKLRFGDKLNYEIDLQEEIEDQKLPPLIIQPFVENALRHGISPKEMEGSILLQAYREDQDMLIVIKDDGVGIPPIEIRKIFANHQKSKYEKNLLGSVGIQNTRKRLINTFGPGYDVEMISRQNSGTTVKIRIPLDYDEGG
jgi:ligand-binding sensor protein